MAANIASVGTVKPQLDIVLWRDSITDEERRGLVEIGVLTHHLQSLAFPTIRIVVHVPEQLALAVKAFHNVAVSAFGAVNFTLADGFAKVLANVDADVALCNQDLGKHPECTIVTTMRQLLNTIEIFVRGFDVPYSFETPVHNQPWTAFYLVSNRSLFEPLLKSHDIITKKFSVETAEFARGLVYNTLSHVLFAHDRFYFYVLQRRVSKRRGWQRQGFEFEVSYVLNGFYLLAYSALDQLALTTNGALGLGIPDRYVSFSGKRFRKALNTKFPAIDGLMNEPNAVKLVETLEILRHHAAHRGALTFTSIVEGPEPTPEAIDAKIREMGWDQDYSVFPPGPIHDWAVSIAKAKARLAIFKVAMSDVLVIDSKGSRYIVNPSPELDCGFLFECVTKVLDALAAV